MWQNEFGLESGPIIFFKLKPKTGPTLVPLPCFLQLPSVDIMSVPHAIPFHRKTQQRFSLTFLSPI